MMSRRYTFVQGLSLGKSKKEQELEQAKARSHAAKTAHRRAKDAEKGYQELVLALTTDHGLIRARANEDLAIDAEIERIDRPADSQNAKTPESRDMIVYQRSSRNASALGLIPSCLSLRQGNSDPFSAYAVRVDAKVNALMTYTREIYLPAMARDATNTGSVIETQDWKQCVRLLSDACTAHAHLARVAAFLSESGTRADRTRQALVFAGDGTSLLRARIEKGIVDDITLHSIFCLLSAESHLLNFEAQRFHARMFAKLLQMRDSPIDYNLLNSVLSFDTVVCRRSLPFTRPAFDVDNWIPSVFARYFKPLLQTLPESVSLEAMEADLDASIMDDEILKDVMIRFRQALVLYLISFSDSTYAKAEYRFWIRYVVMVNHARCINHYLDAGPLCQKNNTFGPLMTGRAQAQAYTSVAILLWTVWASYARPPSQYTAESDTYLFADVLMKALKEKMKESEWMVEDQTQDSYSGRRLWALYVGAYTEQQEVASVASRQPASSGWFNVRFARQARAMDLVTWQQVRERLLPFLYTDVLQPHGSIWFIKTMEANFV